MKRLSIFTVLLFFVFSAFSQKNVLKGRALGLPGNAKLFSLGLGYERFVADFWSAQLLLNHSGWDFGETDGSAEITNAFIIEGRHYFGRHKRATLNKSSFVGVFLEQAWTDLHGGGQPEEDDPKVYEGGKRNSTNLGLIIGQNVQLSKRLYLEFYGGAKYKFGVQQKDYLINQTISTEKKNINKLAARLGCNNGFRF